MNSLNDQIKAARERITTREQNQKPSGVFACSFCHVTYTDRKAHQATELHQQKAEAVRYANSGTYQGEADKDDES